VPLLFRGIAYDTIVVVVLDTNVVISALKSASGASFQLIRFIRLGLLRPALSAPLMFEYEEVASRPGLLPHLSSSDINGFLDWFASVSNLHKIHFLWRPLLKDPKDDMVLEVAASAGAEYVVTYNISDFDRAFSIGIRVITPPQLLTLISSTLL
jgi:putative PIN family toxin of toxin-antitoxin system